MHSIQGVVPGVIAGQAADGGGVLVLAGGGGGAGIGQLHVIPAHPIGDVGGDGMFASVVGEAGGFAPLQNHLQGADGRGDGRFTAV